MSDFSIPDITLPTWPGVTGTPPIVPTSTGSSLGDQVASSFGSGFSQGLQGVLNAIPGVSSVAAGAQAAGLLGDGSNIGSINTPGGVLGQTEQFLVRTFGYAVVNTVVIVILVGGVYLLFKPEADQAIGAVSDHVKRTAAEAAKVAAAE